MSKPIYKLFIGKVTEAWHQLPKTEQDALMAKVNHALETVGGKRLIMCNSAWCTEQYHYWGVEEFPDLEAVQKHTHLLNQLNWGRYVESQSWLGYGIRDTINRVSPPDLITRREAGMIASLTLNLTLLLPNRSTANDPFFQGILGRSNTHHP